MSQKKLFWLTAGCSGGKNTAINYFVELGGGIVPSTSTRDPRGDDEVGGYPLYENISIEEFEQRFYEGGFINRIDYDGNSYGTAKSNVLRFLSPETPHQFGAIGVNEVGIVEAREFAKSQGFELVVVLITPFHPDESGYMEKSLLELKRRMIERGFSEESVVARYDEAEDLYRFFDQNPHLFDEVIITEPGNYLRTREQVRDLLNQYGCLTS